ncbi:MAG: hypothetical protein Q8R31_00565 [Candidatus Omnitrophota bacterium]|nr:hypothetical protein [Candidatus Omnitrophota bacterium]
MQKRTLKYIYISAVLSFVLLFVAKFGGPAILKAYVEIGIGNCRTLPLLCILPEKEIVNLEIDKTYLEELLPYTFPGIRISIPKGFTVIKGQVTKAYYKKRKFTAKSPVIYLLYQKPKFFINIFPQVKKQGVKDNYDFLTRTMNAKFNDIENLTDAFFVIMKTIFTPNLGDQENIKMVKFESAGKKGFINYNLASPENYFDCNVIDSNDALFKIYIKDEGARLDLDKVLAIISTLHASNISALDESK